jgi:hypothetical protein
VAIADMTIANLVMGIALATAAVVVPPSPKAMAEGLQPCDSHAAEFVEDLSDDAKDAKYDEIVVSFMAVEFLSGVSGLQITRSGDQFLLHSLKFGRVYRNDYREVRPGYFEPNPHPVDLEPAVHVVSLSKSVALGLKEVVVSEIAQADQANARSGFDGDGFYFYANGQCAWAWSPHLMSRPERLVDIFKNLKIQALLPSRLLQLFWEKRVLVKLRHINGSSTMPPSLYLVIAVLAVAIVVAGALPLLIASVVMLVPRKIPRKRRFVVVSGALCYGFTCFFALLLLPFFLAGAQLSDELTVDGHAVWASALDFLGKYLLMALFAVWVFFAVTVPIYLRRRWSPTTMNPISLSDSY